MWRTSVLLMAIALVLGVIVANLAPGSMDGLFWKSFFNTPSYEVGWKAAYYIVVPLISLACCGACDNSERPSSKFAYFLMRCITGVLTVLSLVATCILASKYLASRNACSTICDFCNFTQTGLAAETFMLLAYSIGLCLSLKRKPVLPKLGLTNRYWVSALFLTSFLMNEVLERYALAQESLHQGNWFS